MVRLKPDATSDGPAEAGRDVWWSGWSRTLRLMVRLKPDATSDGPAEAGRYVWWSGWSRTLRL